MRQVGNAEDERALRVVIARPKSGPPYATPLVERCEEALGLPLTDQTPETLRLLIGQQIGLDVLLPKALDLLEENILTSGDLYDGDLLAACQKVRAQHWLENPGSWTRLNDILEGFDGKVEQVNKHRKEFLANNPFGAKL